MAFEIEIKRRALREIEDLQENRKSEIRELLLLLKDDPVPFRKMDVVKLHGYENVYRIRIGGTRVVYTVSWTERKILISYIGPRGNAYD
ncbi:MAG: type II toxin-antitoxin system RelE/ParE family toxin [Nitrososphaerota archaeon]|nr:type II toxin-antitoxin system RelE/ParE family toxin [Nitrososphaerota archaeon]MDG6924043.1 type II toxin-antitoxin system RelE/ParE family toxin [Nitrososphaerota archaeon]